MRMSEFLADNDTLSHSTRQGIEECGSGLRSKFFAGRNVIGVAVINGKRKNLNLMY